MSNEQSPQDQEHAKRLQEFQRATELANAEKAQLEAEKARLDAQKALAEQRLRAADDEVKAKATAGKQLADAEKDKIEAERALERARKPPDAAAEALQSKAAAAKAEKDVADAQKAAADASKAAADASKAQADASAAAFKARFGEVPTSPYKGDVSLKENAGKAEALLLAAQAVRSAAAAIVAAIDPKPRSVMLVPSADVPSFDNLLSYRVEIGILQRSFAKMDELSVTAGTAEPPEPGDAQVERSMESAPAERVPPFTAAGLAVEAADKLLGFFKTDYTVGGIDVALEDATLLNELAGRLTRTGVTVYLPKVFNAIELRQAGAKLIDELEDLALRRVNADSAAASHERLAAAWTERAAKEANEASKKSMLSTGDAHARAADAIRKATAAYDSWFAKQSSPNDKNVVPIAAVIREQSLMTALERGRSLLVVKVHASGGSYYTKKNLWTGLGFMPFFNMGGTVVSFALINGQSGVVAAAGTVPVHGGYFKANTVANELVGEPGPPARKRSWWDRLFGTRTTSQAKPQASAVMSGGDLAESPVIGAVDTDVARELGPIGGPEVSEAQDPRADSPGRSH